MARVKITGLDKDIKGLRVRILDAVDRSGFDKNLAKEVALEIRENGIKPDLKPSTVDVRRRVSSKKGRGFAPDKSSLTLSGQLLNNLTSIFQKNFSAFYFGVNNGIHKGYTVKKKNQKGKKKTYKTGGGSQLIEIFAALMKDRPVTKAFDNKQFKERIERRLVSAIKRFFK